MSVLDKLADLLQILTTGNAQLSRMLKELDTNANVSSFRSSLKRKREEIQGVVHQVMNELRSVKQMQLSSQQDQRMLQKLNFTATEELHKFRNTSQSLHEKEQVIYEQMSQSVRSNNNPLLGGYDQLDQSADLQAYDTVQLEKQNEEIRQIEHDMRQLNEIFKDFSVLVQSQQADLDVIDSHIVQTRDNARQGVTELKTASEYQSATRKWMCWIFLILCIVALILGLAFGLKKD